MTTDSRRARQKAQLRQEIIDAARDILAREGYQQLSMRKVAERIEYSPTAIYLHFEDKRDLVFQVCEETFGRLVVELQSLETEMKDPVARLKEIMRRYVGFGLRHPQYYLATFVAVPHEQLPEEMERFNNPGSNGMQALGIVRATIVACMDARKFRKVNADIATRALWAAMHGITSLLIQMPNFAWGDQQDVIDAVIDTTVEGLRLRQGPGSARTRRIKAKPPADPPDPHVPGAAADTVPLPPRGSTEGSKVKGEG